MAMPSARATRASHRAPAGLGQSASIAIAGPGHNNPPELTPLETFAADINDLYDEAKNWLDGTAIENQGQADEVTRLLDAARKSGKAADAKRAELKKPHDHAGKVIQTAWKPLIDKAGKVETGAKTALGKWMIAERQRLDREAEVARQAAEAEAERAREKHQAAAFTGDITAMEEAEDALAVAKDADRDASRIERGKPIAKVEGMARGLGLTTKWSVAGLTDDHDAAQQLAKHYWQTRRAEVVEFYLSLARKDVISGTRSIPGVNITSEQVAR